jgi:hypothetical protein
MGGDVVKPVLLVFLLIGTGQSAIIDTPLSYGLAPSEVRNSVHLSFPTAARIYSSLNTSASQGENR